MAPIFIGTSPRIEAEYEDRGSDVCAVLTHPHSLMGGSMHNNVVMAAWRVCLERGLSVIRFNFRGVGRSTGAFDEGNGEMDDLGMVLDHVKTPALIIGYSFGAWVAARLMKRSRTPSPCIYVSPPTGMFAFPSLKGDTAWAVTGSDDQFCSIPLLEGLMDRDRITVVSGVDHFWFGDEGALEEYLRGRLDVAAAAAVG